ncbi:MAG: ABC transporter ATP-binding protein [Candidatus Saccharibacteria bacterium]|nr:ABC transporter ATP-binding protein [Candidatus Saccharibacteria bacterium]
MSENTLIELKGLTKRYGYGDTETLALKDFDLEIKRGEFIMIMGPSGCGKTTLLDIIGLLDRATRGNYILNGEDVASISANRQAKLRAKKIGFVFQNFNLIEDLPIIENVALPLVYTGYSKTSRLKQASRALARFHLQEREYYYPHQLSGGQQQRVAIARAIVGSPEIILADEPTGNLDSRSSHVVMEELKAIHEEGNTIIMVTHNPALTAYATRVINMLDGQIDTDIKTVADANLPQPISVRFKKRKEKKVAEKAEVEATIELPKPKNSPKSKNTKSKTKAKSTKATKSKTQNSRRKK